MLHAYSSPPPQHSHTPAVVRRVLGAAVDGALSWPPRLDAAIESAAHWLRERGLID